MCFFVGCDFGSVWKETRIGRGNEDVWTDHTFHLMRHHIASLEIHIVCHDVSRGELRLIAVQHLQELHRFGPRCRTHVQYSMM